MAVEIQFPDDLQGLSGLLGDEETPPYNGLFFNLNVGDYQASLFDAVDAVCDTFELAEALGSLDPSTV